MRISAPGLDADRPGLGRHVIAREASLRDSCREELRRHVEEGWEITRGSFLKPVEEGL